MKNKILLLTITAFLAVSPAVFSENSTENIVENTAQEQVTDGINSEDIAIQENNLDEDVETTDAEEVKTSFKQPISKRKLVKKFLIAMLAVTGSSVALYAILSLYNRIRDYSGINVNSANKNAALNSPNNMNDAIKTFLDKTRWE